MEQKIGLRPNATLGPEASSLYIQKSGNMFYFFATALPGQTRAPIN